MSNPAPRAVAVAASTGFAETCDVLVVGAGLSAGPAITRLKTSAPGARILIIDRGSEGPGTAPRIDPPRIIVHADDAPPFETDVWWTDPRIGGAANLWYGQVSRFEPIDFEPLSFPGLDGAITQPSTWPFQIEALLPYYEAVERILSPVSAGPALDPQHVLPSHWTFRREIGKSERLVFEMLTAAGWAPQPGATCLGGHAWSAAPVDPVTLAPLTLRTPSDHSRNWVSRTLATVGKNPKITLWSETRAVCLEACANGFDVLCDRGRERVRVRARRILLACGVIETVNLLRTAGLIRNAQLGRAFTFTTEVTAYVATDVIRDSGTREAAIARIANVSTKALYAPGRHGVVKGGKISIYDARGFEGDARHERKISTLTGADPTSVSPPNRLTLKLSFKGESVPWEGKRIEWDEAGRPKLVYTPHYHDYRLVDLVRSEFWALTELFPGGRLLGTIDNISGIDRTSAHLHGGAIAGNDPTISILNADCALWGAPSLYVADASCMPTSGATNSSLTVMANAMRVADALIESL